MARVTSHTKGEHHRVVAAVLARDGRVLLCDRRDDAAWYPGGWDLAGGHVAPGEAPVETLRRECRVRRWSGEPANLAPAEHQEIGWFDIASLSALTLADPRLGALLRGVLGEP